MQRNSQFAALCLWVILMTLSMNLWAQQPPSQQDTLVDKVHRGLSSRISGTFQWLDSYLANEEGELDDNPSVIHLSLGAFAQRGEKTETVSRLKLRARLPQTENRLQVFVLGETEDISTTDTEWEAAEQEYSDADNQNLTVGVAYTFDSPARHRLNLSSGLRFSDGSLIFYLGPSYLYRLDLGQWDFRFKTRITWYDEAGLESRLAWQFDRPLSSSRLFRIETRLNWFEEEEGLFPQFNLSLRKKLDDRRYLSLRWNNYFITEPRDELDTSIISLQYRQQFWRPWLWLEVTPQVAYPKEDDYHDVPGLLVSFHATF